MARTYMAEFENKKYDADKDGFLSEKEFLDMRRDTGNYESQRALKEMKELDIDNDGTISYLEYAFWRMCTAGAATEPALR